MKKIKKFLIAGLTLAMAASIGVGISACGGHTHTYDAWDHNDTQHWKYCDEHGSDKSNIDESTKADHDFTNGDCVCGAKKPTPTHEHNYDAWDYDDTQHWKYCDEHGDDKSNIDETTKENHTIKDGACECGYHIPEIYLTGTIASQPGSQLPEVWDKQGKNVLEQVRANCIKMELGADGKTYEAEVALSTKDRFRVYDAVKGISYPGTVVNITGLAVEEDNGYIVSWEKGKTPTWKVHDHDFTAYAKDENQHWKVCTLDGTAEPGVEKQDHDFTNGDCICGQKAPEGCKHENGFAFAYETLPECNAEGGTLQKTCPDCLATEDVHYDKGLGVEFYETSGPKTVLTSAGTYYLRGVDGFRFETTQAGTYTIGFAGKLRPAMEDVYLCGFHIGSSYSPAIHTTLSAIAGGQTGSKYDEQIKAYGVVIDGYESGAHKQFNSLTFTVKDTDVADGKQVCLQIEFKVSILTTSRETDGYLITIECPQAASVSAAQEVAMLPGKED